jgi:hypothetical protein
MMNPRHPAESNKKTTIIREVVSSRISSSLFLSHCSHLMLTTTSTGTTDVTATAGDHHQEQVGVLLGRDATTGIQSTLGVRHDIGMKPPQPMR